MISSSVVFEGLVILSFMLAYLGVYVLVKIMTISCDNVPDPKPNLLVLGAQGAGMIGLAVLLVLYSTSITQRSERLAQAREQQTKSYTAHRFYKAFDDQSAHREALTEWWGHGVSYVILTVVVGVVVAWFLSIETQLRKCARKGQMDTWGQLLGYLNTGLAIGAPLLSLYLLFRIVRSFQNYSAFRAHGGFEKRGVNELLEHLNPATLAGRDIRDLKAAAGTLPGAKSEGQAVVTQADPSRKVTIESHD
jgi:hypothetical protein